MRFVVIALALGCTPGDVDVDMGDRYIYDENYDQVTADECGRGGSRHARGTWNRPKLQIHRGPRRLQRDA